MFFVEHDIDVYRKTKAANNLSDPTWTLDHTLSGTVQPFTGGEAVYGSQRVENVRDLLVFSDPEVDIKKDDELYYIGEYRRVAYIQRFRSGVMDHCEVLTTDSQWKRNG